MILNKPYTNKQYADFIVEANKKNLIINNKGDFLEAVSAPEKELNYFEKRAIEFPSIQDQLDMQYWDKINNTNNWISLISSIKEKYPKE